MKCIATNNKKQSKNKVIDFMMTAIAYVLFEHGNDGEKVIKILKDIQDVADSMVRDYVKFGDIQKVLKEEYGFKIDFEG